MDLPKIVESPDFQANLKNKLDRFTEAYRKIYTDFETPTAADPLYHIFVELTLVEVLGNERINFAAYSQLVKLSNEIEFIFRGKIREGESYEAYRDRMRGTKDLASPAGTEAMYKALTFLYGEATVGGKTIQVKDAYVKNVDGSLFIYVMTNSDDRTQNDPVIKALTAAFQKETVKPALDEVAFIQALNTPFSIAATIKLQPGYKAAYKASIEESFRKSFEAQKRLGWLPTISWIIKELHLPGVLSVELISPVTINPPAPERYAIIQRIELTVTEAV